LQKKRSEIKFIASFPNIQTAICQHGNGDGFLVKLDIPQSEHFQIMKLGLLTSCAFKVSVEVPEEHAREKEFLG